ncbi:MAG: polysaccharide pyruvyl transferase family protein [Hyphomonadaceae bacterium]|nr:polysaccharide pyruvyl transferase family protein [Hyphomonadaceae bacterium]
MDDGQPIRDIAGVQPVAPPRAPRIALIGWFGSGNFGNDASCEAVLGRLRKERPDADIFIVCNDPKGIAARFGAPAAKLRIRFSGLAAKLDTALLRLPSALTNWVYALRTMAGADLLVFPGTGIFDDYRNGPMGAASQILRWCAAARARGAQVAFLSAGAGPIKHPLSRVMMRAAAKLASRRSYRDAESKEFMESIGVDETHSAVLPDVAFLLPTPPSPDRVGATPLTVGLGVMSYHGWTTIKAGELVHRDYIGKLVKFVNWLALRGHRVKLLIGEESDWRAVEKVRKALSPEALAALDPVADMHDLHDVMNEIAGCDIVVASRFHVIVAALKMGRPAISLSYGYKNDAVLTAAGLKGFFQDADFFDYPYLQDQFATLEAGRQHAARLVRERVATFQEALLAKDALLPETV